MSSTAVVCSRTEGWSQESGSGSVLVLSFTCLTLAFFFFFFSSENEDSHCLEYPPIEGGLSLHARHSSVIEFWKWKLTANM